MPGLSGGVQDLLYLSSAGNLIIYEKSEVALPIVLAKAYCLGGQCADKKSPRFLSPSPGAPSEQLSSPEELFDSDVCLNPRHHNSSKVLGLWHSGGLLKLFPSCRCRFHADQTGTLPPTYTAP